MTLVNVSMVRVPHSTWSPFEAGALRSSSMCPPFDCKPQKSSRAVRPSIINPVDLEKTLLRKVGEAIHRYRMIRDGDRVAVALSGGKDSATLLELLLRLQRRAPVEFTLSAFTVEQGKFLRPIEPLAEYLKERGVAWTYYRDKPSLRLINDQPEHGCDLCSRFRRRAVYEVARGLGANVVAFGLSLIHI